MTRVEAASLPSRIEVVDRDVRIGDGGLLEVLVHAAAAALVAGLQLDGHARAVVDLDPLDAVFLDGLPARLAGRDLLPLAAAVEDFGLVALGVDLDLVVVGRLAPADLAT